MHNVPLIRAEYLFLNNGLDVRKTLFMHVLVLCLIGTKTCGDERFGTYAASTTRR